MRFAVIVHICERACSDIQELVPKFRSESDALIGGFCRELAGKQIIYFRYGVNPEVLAGLTFVLHIREVGGFGEFQFSRAIFFRVERLPDGSLLLGFQCHYLLCREAVYLVG